MSHIFKKIYFKIKNNDYFLSESAVVSKCKLGRLCNISHHAELVNSNIGVRTSVGRYTKIDSAQIGSYCSISWDVSIGAKSHPIEHISGHAFSFRKQFQLVDIEIDPRKILSTIIGHDVWIGCNAVIMSGITVGDGAVIGAGAIVTHDIEPYSVSVGVPAKTIKKRFDDNIINNLKEIRWWEFPDEILKSNISLFQRPIDNDIIEKLMKIRREL